MEGTQIIMAKFAPSAEQVAIGEAVAASLNDWRKIRGIAMDAGAGCGKTTALMYLITDIIPRKYSVVLVAFNRKNKLELDEKIKEAGVEKARAQTFNGLGFGAFMRHYNIDDADSLVNVDNNKYHKIARYLIEKHLGKHNRAPEQINEAVGMLAGLWSYLRYNTTRDHRTGELVFFLGGKLKDADSTTAHGLSDKTILRKFTKRYHQFLEVEEDEDVVLDLIPHMARLGYQAMTEPKKFKEEFKSAPLLTRHIDERRWIDLTDQMYYCVIEKWKCWGYTVVLIDEAQDASPLGRALADMHRWERGGRTLGRVVLVGDPQQAIYMFRGADGDGFYNSMYYWYIDEAFPLSVSYRAPKLIAELARKHKKEFHSFEGNIDGEIATVNETDLIEMAQDGDACISRIRSAAVSWWRKFLAAGKPAILIGNGMGDNVLKILDAVSGLEGFRYEKVFEFIERYKEIKLFKMEQRERPDEEVLRFIDEMNTTQYFVEIVEDRHPATNSLDSCKDWIEWELDAANQPSEGIKIMTAHICKGLEFDRVFDITPDKFPLNWKDQTPEEFTQEMNLDYVKNTRAKQALFTVDKLAGSYLKRGKPPEPVAAEKEPEPVPEPTFTEDEPVYCNNPARPMPGTMDFFAWKKIVSEQWAKNMIEKDWVVLDFETTGIGGEPVQIAVIDKTGKALLSTLVKPETHIIESKAKAIHKIGDEQIKDAPTFKDVYAQYKEAIDGKIVVAYNAPFETTINAHTCDIYDLESPTITGWEDPMLVYAAYRGKWSAYHKSFSWQKLTVACEQMGISVDGPAHDALVDVEMTRQLIYAMAGETAPPAPERDPMQDVATLPPSEKTIEMEKRLAEAEAALGREHVPPETPPETEEFADMVATRSAIDLLKRIAKEANEGNLNLAKSERIYIRKFKPSTLESSPGLHISWYTKDASKLIQMGFLERCQPGAYRLTGSGVAEIRERGLLPKQVEKEPAKEPEPAKVENPAFKPAPAKKDMPKPLVKPSPIEDHLVKIFEQLPNNEIDLLIQALEGIKESRTAVPV
jgi:DNA polymerase III epsilon subunit-like protein